MAAPKLSVMMERKALLPPHFAFLVKAFVVGVLPCFVLAWPSTFPASLGEEGETGWVGGNSALGGGRHYGHVFSGDFQSLNLNMPCLLPTHQEGSISPGEGKTPFSSLS